MRDLSDHEEDLARMQRKEEERRPPTAQDYQRNLNTLEELIKQCNPKKRIPEWISSLKTEY